MLAGHHHLDRSGARLTLDLDSRQFFLRLPREVEEAAFIDGCSTLQAFRHVVLPGVVPGVAAIAILTFVIAWNEFVVALTFISSSELKTYQLGLYDFLTTDAQIFRRYGNIYAAAAIGFVPTFIGYMLVQRQFIAGLTAGAAYREMADLLLHGLAAYPEESDPVGYGAGSPTPG